MSTALKGTLGPLKDQVFPLKVGLTLGRKGNLVINDPKASSIHARIESGPGEELMIVDNDSKNGLMVDGSKAPMAELKPGVKILIGDHEFEVIAHVVSQTPPLPRKAKYWHEILADFLTDNLSQAESSRRSLQPLRPALVLEFQKGPQMDTRWVLGYGPRKIGAKCIDLPIFEPTAPDVCFEIVPAPQGLIFKTKHPGTVLLNGAKVDNQVLRVGDSIRIHDTIIEVDFSE